MDKLFWSIIYVSYLNIRVEVATEGVYSVGAFAGQSSNFKVLFPRMAELELTMTRLPACKVSLQKTSYDQYLRLFFK
jgi:hypothetical protein